MSLRSFCISLPLPLLSAAIALAQTPTPAPTGGIDEKLFRGMQWRQVGPFRGGRALAVEGVPGEPSTFYFGAVAGGVWKTTDGGANWAPLFDKESISSIGAIAVARDAPGVFAKDDVEVVETFADQAAIAIGNARLIDAVERVSRDEAGFSEESLEALAKLTEPTEVMVFATPT